MYEDNMQPRPQRLIRLAILILLVAALLWVLTWLVFFRQSDNKKVAAPSRPATSQSINNGNGSSGNSVPSGGNSGVATAPANGAKSQNSSPTPNGSGTANPSPSELVNTGAGNVVLPVVIAVAVGGMLYQVRLRLRKSL